MSRKSLVQSRLFCYIICMLHVTNTNTALEGYKSLYRRLRANNVKKSKHIFIVPDRFTLGVEKEICEFLESDGSFNISVFSVTRLATKTFGKKINKCLSKEGTVLLLNKVLKENREKLSYYTSINSYMFCQEMFAAMSSLRNSGITEDDIEECLPMLEGDLQIKLKDIALVYRQYMASLKEKYVDTITRVDYLINNLQYCQEITSSHIYFLGFNLYSNQQLRLIKEMARVCQSVNLSVTADSFGTNKHCFPVTQTEEIIDDCKNTGIEVVIEEAFSVLKSPFDHLHRELFGFTQQPVSDKNDSVILFAEENPYEEVKAVAREINYLIKKGLRYKDIALVCNNEEYLDIVAEIFNRCGIPYFAEQKHYVKHSVFFKYVLCLYGAVVSGYAKSDILKLIHHPFANVESEDSFEIENYIARNNVDYGDFCKAFSVNATENIEKTRLNLIEQLSKVPANGKSIADNCNFVIDLLNREDIVNTLRAHEKSLDDKLVAGSKTDSLVALLEEIKEINGLEETTTQDFYYLLKAITAEMSVSLLPRYTDMVFVGNTNQSRFSEHKAIFVIGANSGYFPVQKGDNLIFSALDSEFMKRKELNVFPSPLEYNTFEQFMVIDLITKAENIYVGCSSFGILGEELAKGEGLREMEYLLKTACKPLVDYHSFSQEEKTLYYLINVNNAYYEFIHKKVPDTFVNALSDYLHSKGRLVDKDNSATEAIEFSRLFKTDKKGRFLTSVSQLESYFKCPFRHFLSYGLKIKEEENGEIKANVVGIFIHNVLENYFKDNYKILKTEENYLPLIDKAINKEMKNSAYSGLINNVMNRYAFNNICNECKRLLAILTENYKKSRFDAAYFEYAFGYEDGEEIIIEVEGKTFSLRGKIDRVDFYKNNVLIIDYKTGKADKAFKETYYGSKIQLYVYLSHFLDKGYFPAGVFYLPIKAGYVKDGKSYGYIGHMSNDIDIYCAIDGNGENIVDEKYDSKILEYSLIKKNGEAVVKKVSGVMSKEDFYAVKNYVFRLIEKNLDEMSKGNIDKSPIEDECKYCIYSGLCGDVCEREFSAKNISDFYAEEEKC
ncbi:hypothetical protein EOM82_02950 [bacterium]|nr:hypothetical protein [bacterium]